MFGSVFSIAVDEVGVLRKKLAETQAVNADLTARLNDARCSVMSLRRQVEANPLRDDYQKLRASYDKLRAVAEAHGVVVLEVPSA